MGLATRVKPFPTPTLPLKGRGKGFVVHEAPTDSECLEIRGTKQKRV
jgi:hypothetical protein